MHDILEDLIMIIRLDLICVLLEFLSELFNSTEEDLFVLYV